MRDTDKPSLTILRYSSRKLYNKNTREFVTLDDISRLIRAGHSVTILDKKTGEDITNQYLLTIISEFEGQGEPVIPKDFLTEIIKGYSDAATQVWPKAIEQMMQAYQQNQQNFAKAFGAAPFDSAGTEKNIETIKLFQDMQSKMMSGMWKSWEEFNSPVASSTTSMKDVESDSTQLSEVAKAKDLSTIREQINELEQQLANLKNKI